MCRLDKQYPMIIPAACYPWQCPVDKWCVRRISSLGTRTIWVCLVAQKLHDFVIYSVGLSLSHWMGLCNCPWKHNFELCIAPIRYHVRHAPFAIHLYGIFGVIHKLQIVHERPDSLALWNHLTPIVAIEHSAIVSNLRKLAEGRLGKELLASCVPYFADYRSHSIISHTPNSDSQSLCFKNYPQLDQETPVCDSLYILRMHMHVWLSILQKNKQK